MSDPNDRMAIPRWLPVLAWVVTIALFYGAVGGWVAERLSGNDVARLPRWPLWVSLASLLGSLALQFACVRAGPKPADGSGGRRRFLAGLAAGGAGVFAALVAVVARNAGWLTTTGPAIWPRVQTQAPNPRPRWKGARVASYRRLGRTGFEVSDISLGSSRIRGVVGERVARLAIERGVNYFDTSPDYAETGSERVLGRAMKGRRDEMFVATKFCTPNGNLPAGTPVADYIAAVEGSLERLQTDRVDLVHIHSCDTLDRLLDPNVHEAFDRLKEQGKARFLGFSSHTPNLEQVTAAAIESGRFDVMMLAYHHGAFPGLSGLIDRGHAAGMGVVAMKTLKGAKHQGLLESRSQQDSYTQAAFKWVLANPAVSCLVVSFHQPAHVDEYLHASGQRPGAGDRAILDRYDEGIAGTHCYPHCGACLDHCPEGLPIHDVLRFRMYFEDYGDEREAMRQYARLDVRADVCTGCAAPCANACPFGVPIPERTRDTHRLLTG